MTDLPGLIRPGNAGGDFQPPAPLAGKPARSFAPGRPHVGHYLGHGGILNLQTKRGCCFQCIYCTYPKIEGRQMRRFDPDQVAAEARRLQEAGAAFLFVTDSAFNADIDHSLAVARAFQKAGLCIPWGAYIAPVPLPPSYFDTMARAGMTHAELGTDAFCDPILQQYRKPFACADVFRAHNAAVSAGIHAAHFFLLGAPGESAQTIDATLENAAALEKSACFFFTGIRIYPGTKIAQIAAAEGQIPENADLLVPAFYRPGQISDQQIRDRLAKEAKNRLNWIVGDGGDQSAKIISRLHARGHTGPLWEHLVR